MQKPNYLQMIHLIERLHQALHENIRAEFAAMGWDDINPRQALMLFNIGKGNEVLFTEIRAQNLYVGSNPAYNLKQLTEGQYITQVRSEGDRRRIRIRLTPKGEEVCEVVDELYDRHLKAVPVADGVTLESIEDISRQLTRLERFWSDLTARNVVV